MAVFIVTGTGLNQCYFLIRAFSRQQLERERERDLQVSKLLVVSLANCQGPLCKHTSNSPPINVYQYMLELDRQVFVVKSSGFCEKSQTALPQRGEAWLRPAGGHSCDTGIFTSRLHQEISSLASSCGPVGLEHKGLSQKTAETHQVPSRNCSVFSRALMFPLEASRYTSRDALQAVVW